MFLRERHSYFWDKGTVIPLVTANNNSNQYQRPRTQGKVEVSQPTCLVLRHSLPASTNLPPRESQSWVAHFNTLPKTSPSFCSVVWTSIRYWETYQPIVTKFQRLVVSYLRKIINKEVISFCLQTTTKLECWKPFILSYKVETAKYCSHSLTEIRIF